MTTSEQHATATAYWTVGPEQGELRSEDLPAPGPGEALVRTLYSGISKGTELVVHQRQRPAVRRRGDGRPATRRGTSRPGEVRLPLRGRRRGRARRTGPGKTVFCLYPHQDRYVVPVESLTVIPDGVPARRAVLTGTVETAVNGLWEAGPRLGDRVAVIGAGLVGGMVAKLLAGFPLGAAAAGRRRPRQASVRRRPRRRLQPPRRRPAGLRHRDPLLRLAGRPANGACSWWATRATSSRCPGTPTAKSPCRWGRTSTPAGCPSAPARWASWPAPAGTAAPTPTGSRSPCPCCRIRCSTSSSPAPPPFAELPGVVQQPRRRHAWTPCATSLNTRRRNPPTSPQSSTDQPTEATR